MADYPTAIENGFQRQRKESHTALWDAVAKIREDVVNEREAKNAAQKIVDAYNDMHRCDEFLNMIELARSQEHEGITE
jgi:hypothetical protein